MLPTPTPEMEFLADGPSELNSSFKPHTYQSLYVGNLHPYVTETLLLGIFSSAGFVSDVKIIKDKLTGLSAGYGFVEFLDKT